jgi:replicative superfamily II helicase
MYQYARRLAHSIPIESQLHHRLEDHLNAEISLRTVTDVDDAIQWLRYTFLYVRLMKDPLKYMMAAEMHSYDYVEEKLGYK